MTAGLKASVHKYRYSRIIYNAEFEKILSKVIACYLLMVNNHVQLVNDENKIRDIMLVNYLNNNGVRKTIGLTDYLFNREVPEDHTIGRTDIKIETQNTFLDTGAYYIIECKRIDAINQTGMTGLNAKYIKDGMCRFISRTYSTHCKTNGMIGFIVEPIDIDNNVAAINDLLRRSFRRAKTIREIKKRKIVAGFNYSYVSKHKTNKREITLYHLMLDFVNNVH